MAIDFEINEQIRDREIRLIGADGNQVGVIPTKKALMMAMDEGLDLVKVSPNAKPPVCKIIDYGKFKYELVKKEKEAKKKQTVIVFKEVRFSPNIDTNDLQTKMNQTKKFIESGCKVKVSMTFRGREAAFMQNNKYMLEEFADKLKDIAIIEKGIKEEGKNLVMTLVAK